MLRYGFFSNAQLGPDGVPTGPAEGDPDLHVVGIGVFNDDVVEDDVDQNPQGPDDARPDPPDTRLLRRLRLERAAAPAAVQAGGRAVEREYLALLPPGDPYFFHVTSVVEAEAEQALRPESVALGVFGIIAALTALIIGTLAISRQSQLDTGDRVIMRALGAGPVSTAADGLIGTLLAVVVGSLGAAAVALALSPIRFGPVRGLEPGGLSADWLAIGLGVLGSHRRSWEASPSSVAALGGPHRIGVRAGQHARRYAGGARHHPHLPVVGTRRHGHPLRTLFGPRGICRSRPVGDRRRGVGGNGGGHGPHLRQQPRHPYLPSPSLRVELELHDGVERGIRRHIPMSS